MARQKYHLIWNKDRHSVGIASIDAQHQEIMERVNLVADAVGQGTPASVLLEMMDELITFACAHFALEERLMTEYGYPDLESHVEEHRGMIQQINDLKEALRSPNPTKAALVSAFLTDWAELHILQADKEIGEFLVGKGLD